MRKPHRICAKLAQNGHILVKLLPGRRIAAVLPVLMARHTAQGDAVPVEEEALLRVNFKTTPAKRNRNLVAASVRAGNAGNAGIQCRPFQAVPQCGIFELDHGIGKISPVFGACYGLPFRRKNLIEDSGAGAANEMRFNGKASVAVFFQLGRKQYALSAVIQQIEMCLRRTDQVDIPVKAAENRKITGKRANICEFAIVNKNSQPIFAAGRTDIRDIKTECGVTAAVFAEKMLVQVSATNGVGALKIQIETDAGALRGTKHTGINTAITQVGAASLSIFRILGMEQAYRPHLLCILCKGRLEGSRRGREKPVIVQRKNRSHFHSSL